MELKYYCDDSRHLVCTPYNIENLHRMASDLGIHRCWFHAGSNSHRRHAHYDIPKSRITEIMSRCTVVSARDILNIIKTGIHDRDPHVQSV